MNEEFKPNKIQKELWKAAMGGQKVFCARGNYRKLIKMPESPPIEETMITLTAVCPDGSITISRIAPEDYYKMKKDDQ